MAGWALPQDKLCDCGCGGYHTWQPLWDVLAWSLRQMLIGRSPAFRHNRMAFTRFDQMHRMEANKEIPHAALLQLRGDWEWVSQCFRFRSPGAQSFCWMCEATTSGLYDYKDFDPHAPHRGTLFDHQTYVLKCGEERQQPSSLFHCPGTEIQHVAVDSMHSGDLGFGLRLPSVTSPL